MICSRHRRRMCCSSLSDGSDVLYRAIQFWFKTNACKFLHDISDACFKYNTRYPGDLVLFADFFPEVVALRVVPACSFLSGIFVPGIDIFPFRYSEEKQKRAVAHLVSAFPRSKCDGILVFANYLDYGDTTGYSIFRLTMPHDTSGIDCISEDFVLAVNQESDFRLIGIVSRNNATKIRREFGTHRPKKKTKNPPRPLSTRLCRYELV